MTAAAAASAFVTNCKSIKSKLIKMHLPGKTVTSLKLKISNEPTFETFIDTFAMFTLDHINTITAPRSHSQAGRVLA